MYAGTVRNLSRGTLLPMPKRRKTPPELVALRRRFNVALAEAGTSLTKWCSDHDWTRPHVALTLSGDRESRRVIDAVKAFTDAQEQKMAARLAAPAGGSLAVA